MCRLPIGMHSRKQLKAGSNDAFHIYLCWFGSESNGCPLELAAQMPDTLPMSTTTLSLYEQLGGDAAVNAAVDVFYRKVLTDDRVSRFFDGVDMDRQAAKQKAFLTMVFGGPSSYSGQDMRTAHARLVEYGPGRFAFRCHCGTVRRNAEGDWVSADDLISEVAAIAESTRNRRSKPIEPVTITMAKIRYAGGDYELGTLVDRCSTASAERDFDF